MSVGRGGKMNMKKLTVIVALLVVIAGSTTYLFASGIINIPGLIQTGDYFDPELVHHINTDQLAEDKGLNLNTTEIEDYYSTVVAKIYNQDTEMYTTGKIDFAMNTFEDGSFDTAYIVQGSEKVKNVDENSAEEAEGLTEEQHAEIVANMPEEFQNGIGECETKEECEARSTEEKEAATEYEEQYAAAYETSAKELGYLNDEDTDGNIEERFTDADIIVNQYETEESFNNAISEMFNQEMTFADLKQFEV